MHDVLEGIVQCGTRLLFEYLPVLKKSCIWSSQNETLDFSDFSEDIAAFHRLYFKASHKVGKKPWS